METGGLAEPQISRPEVQAEAIEYHPAEKDLSTSSRASTFAQVSS